MTATDPDLFDPDFTGSGTYADRQAFPAPVPGGPVRKWFYEKPPRAYGPFVVRALARAGDELTFQVLHCKTGEALGKAITVCLLDGTRVHGDLPSTAQLATPGDPARDCGFLFLTAAFLAELDAANKLPAADAHLAQGRSKWPKGAGGRAVLQRLLEKRGVSDLSPADYDDLAELLGATG